MIKATGFIFDALGLATEKENSVVEVCTGDLDSVLKDLNSQSPVAIDAEGIFIASTVADVCCFDASLVEGLAVEKTGNTGEFLITYSDDEGFETIINRNYPPSKKEFGLYKVENITEE